MQQGVNFTVHRSVEGRIRSAMRTAFEGSLRRTSIAPKRGGFVLIETSEKGIVTMPNVEVYQSMGAASFAMQEKALKAAFLAMAPIVQDLVLERLREPSDELVAEAKAALMDYYEDKVKAPDYEGEITTVLAVAANHIEANPKG